MKRPIGLILIILTKAVMGIVEAVFGAALILVLLLLKPLTFFSWIAALFSIGFHLGLFLLILGITKIVLAIGIWHRSMLIRNLGMIFFIGVGLYELYHLIQHYSTLKMLVFAFDAFIVYYFWKVVPKHMRPEEAINILQRHE